MLLIDAQPGKRFFRANQNLLYLKIAKKESNELNFFEGGWLPAGGRRPGICRESEEFIFFAAG